MNLPPPLRDPCDYCRTFAGALSEYCPGRWIIIPDDAVDDMGDPHPHAGCVIPDNQ